MRGAFISRKARIMIIAVFILLDMCCICYAETTVLRFDFELYSNDSIILKNIVAGRGTFEEGAEKSRPFQILLVDGDDVRYISTFDETFMRLTDPPSLLGKKIISKKVPYLGNIGDLLIYHDDNLMLRYDMQDLCNHDRQCASFENEITCADDCVPERSMREELSQLMLQKEEKIMAEDYAGQQKLFSAIITIIFMILALILIIILTKHKKENGRRR